MAEEKENNLKIDLMEFSIISERKKIISTQQWIPEQVEILDEDKKYTMKKPHSVMFIVGDSEKLVFC